MIYLQVTSHPMIICISFMCIVHIHLHKNVACKSQIFGFNIRVTHSPQDYLYTVTHHHWVLPLAGSHYCLQEVLTQYLNADTVRPGVGDWVSVMESNTCPE